METGRKIGYNIDRMLVPRGTNDAEILVKNSRFLSRAESVTKPEEARALIKKRRGEHPGANHVVHAFITGERAEVSGCSDDREPSGTAGRPVLEVLKGSGITNIIITIVRYFGGTKLGTGGLVHAYSEAAKAALAGLPTAEFTRWTAFTLSLSYDLFERARSALIQEGAEINREDFSSEIVISGRLPEKGSASLQERIRTLSNGKTVVYFEKEEDI
jgi:uncharacterized YigZ family protein